MRLYLSRATLAPFLILGLLASAPARAAPLQRPATSSQQSGSTILTGSQRGEIVEAIATAAETRYVDPAGGRALAAHLRKRFAAGSYDQVRDPLEFAATLTKDMRAAVADVHLRAVYEPNRAASTIVQPQSGPAGPTSSSRRREYSRIDARSQEQIARTNYGFEAAERLDGNVGYLKITRFVPLDFSAKAASTAMDFVANTDALIVDLRGNIGGSPDLVRQLLSYFTGPVPVQLLSHYVRGPNTTNTMMSLADVPGAKRTNSPLYVLIDRHSASSAEAFAYIVQRKKLGLVIGETSSGAGNGGNMVPVGSNISVFIPFSRVSDGPGWEQTGIKPDVEVSPDGALDTAHKLALEKLAAAAEDPVLRREREWALELATRSTSNTGNSRSRLQDYAGSFGTRAFKVEGEKLLVVPSAGQPEPLIAVSADVFRLDNARYSFVRGASQDVVSVTVETLAGTELTVPRSD